jgi:hypothetical protein
VKIPRWAIPRSTGEGPRVEERPRQVLQRSRPPRLLEKAKYLAAELRREGRRADDRGTLAGWMLQRVVKNGDDLLPLLGGW